MIRRASQVSLIFAIIVSLLLPVVSAPVQAAEGDSYSLANVATNLTVPVAMQFAPDGHIFIAEKYGDIKIVHDHGDPTLFGSIDVNGDFEQGLLGMVLDPNYAANGYIYIAYTRPDGDFNRVSRISAMLGDKSKMQPGSEVVLIDNIPSPTGIHQMGEMQIGNDGKLYVASGDGAIDSQSSNQLNNLGGKFLRINLDGSIPADNPFVGQPGARGEIWAYGLRNPFSSSKQSSTGRIFVNDVGRDTWEEINELQAGANYGFPTCEGKCQPTRAGFTDPVYQYGHYDGLSPVVGRSITAGAWYEGTNYEAGATGDYFFGDYVAGWVKRLNPATGQVKNVIEGLPGIVNLKVGPDGLMYAVQLDVNTGTGTIKKINYGQPVVPPPTSGNQLAVYAAGTPAGGQYPDMQILVNDVVVATRNGVTGNPYTRQFNEYLITMPAGTTADMIKINFINDAMINGQDRNLHIDRIVLNGTTVQTEDPLVLSTGSWNAETGCNPGNKRSEELACGGYFQYGTPVIANQKPTANIITPVAETHYNGGTVINFSGTGSDAEDGTLAAQKLSWKVVFHHDTHTHPFLDFVGINQGTFTIPDAGETAADTFYRIALTATDSNGQITTTTRDIFPNLVKLGLSTNVPGLQLNLDGEPRQTPLSIDAVTGIKRTISAPLTQTVNNQTYDFAYWSDGGTASHSITTPNTNTTYQAFYTARNVTPPPAGDTTSFAIHAAGSPAQGIYPTMELQIDGQTVQTFTDVRGNFNNRQFNTYAFTINQNVDLSRVRINFPNDALINGEDRNLYVDKIVVNGVAYESEAQTTYSTGTWAPSSGCAPGNKQSETLSCGGYFAYSAGAITPPTPETSKVTIFAAGSPAAGVYPNLRITVDGATVRSFPDIRGSISTRTFQQYSFDLPYKLKLGQTQIHFDNDALIFGEDRNLYIDKIIVDGTTYEAEAPGIYSVGSWNAAGGCGGGNKQSETLSCNGYFQF